jgi:mRNA-degrading endonuclease toxin of MazEF toxin-antitoxin module
MAGALAPWRESACRVSGFDGVSYAKCEDIKSVSEHRLISRLGEVDAEAIFAMTRVLRFPLDF